MLHERIVAAGLQRVFAMEHLAEGLVDGPAPECCCHFGIEFQGYGDVAFSGQHVGGGGEVTVRAGDALHAPSIKFEFGLEWGLGGRRYRVRHSGMEDAHPAVGGFRENHVKQSAGCVPNQTELRASLVQKFDGFGVDEGIDGLAEADRVAGKILRGGRVNPFKFHFTIIGSDKCWEVNMLTENKSPLRLKQSSPVTVF